ncbi:hypothetical protein S40288_03282 [Stachybotrys chartarum IBT 40288]|nr:hypothetical protein S40288_03282 [Stachybotrys chartarum IBT 40288]
MAVPQRSTPSHDELESFFLGRNIHDVPKPAVVIDRAKMQRHCDSLRQAIDALQVGFRTHVKTHKTREGARLQIGENNKDIKLVVSTIAELEHLLPLLKELRDAGASINVLYGIPLPGSQGKRLAELGRQLGQGSISVMIDHPAQLSLLSQFRDEAGFPAGVFLKIDTGYHRAGLPPAGVNKDDLVPRVMKLESEGQAFLHGLYSHSSLSYNDSTPEEAMANLEGEIHGCLDALNKNAHLFSKDKELIISVGASPQVTAVENLVDSSPALAESVQSLRKTIQTVTTGNPDGFRTSLELHAGVYSLLDVQQLSTKSRANIGSFEDEIAISVVTEVCSVYNNGEREQPEALLGVGVLGLGREPCFAYKGWGVVHREAYPDAKPEQRLIVARVSQEHSIVTWDGTRVQDAREQLPQIALDVGQSVRVLPNHACITGAMYGWYLVVDSSKEDPNEIVDVWVRASGW